MAAAVAAVAAADAFRIPPPQSTTGRRGAGVPGWETDGPALILLTHVA